MSIVYTDSQNYTDIANAIRGKNGSSDTYKPDEMAAAITAIPSGGTTINNQDKTVTPTESTQIITKDNNTYTGLGTVTVNPIPSQYKDTSDATATASDIWFGKTAYNSSGLITGTSALTLGTIRPDAELIQTYTYDKLINEDEEITIPAYTTTATTLKASVNLSPTISLDYANYNYYVLERFLTIPIYNDTVKDTKAKGRTEYCATSQLYEVAEIPANNFIALVDGTTKYTSRTLTCTVQAFTRLLYWSSATAVTPYSTSAYGTYQAVTAPSVSSGVMTVKSPGLGIRGHTTYFTSTFMNGLSDIRYQYVIEVYRAPKNNLNLNGWGSFQNLQKVIDCVNTTNHNLV